MLMDSMVEWEIERGLMDHDSLALVSKIKIEKMTCFTGKTHGKAFAIYEAGIKRRWSVFSYYVIGFLFFCGGFLIAIACPFKNEFLPC